MAEPLRRDFAGLRRLAVLMVVLSFFTACGPDGGPRLGPPEPTPLVIQSVSPNTSIAAVVTIFGTGFRTGATVTFGGVNAEVLNVVSTSLLVRVPDLAPGRLDVVVTNPSGESATLAGGFTVTPFAVTAIVPQRGYPGTLFFMQGDGLIPGTMVSFGRVPSPSVHAGLFSSTGLGGIVPTHDLGPVDITVTHPSGRSLTIPNGITSVPGPVVTAFPLTVTAGSSATVNWTADPVGPEDFISICSEQSASGQPPEGLVMQLVPSRSTSGSLTFEAPSSPGRYQACYLPYAGQWGALAARSNVFTVTAATPTHAYDIAAILRGPTVRSQTNRPLSTRR